MFFNIYKHKIESSIINRQNYILSLNLYDVNRTGISCDTLEKKLVDLFVLKEKSRNVFIQIVNWKFNMKKD